MNYKWSKQIWNEITRGFVEIDFVFLYIIFANKQQFTKYRLWEY